MKTIQCYFGLLWFLQYFLPKC